MYINNDGKENSLFKLLSGLALGFIKFLLICFSVPVVFVLCLMFFLISISIYLMFDGIIFIGVLLGLLFVSLLVIWFLVLVSMFIFNKKISFKKMLILFLVGIIGVGISSGIITLEVASFDYSNEVPVEATVKRDHFEKEMSDDLYLMDYYMNYMFVEDESKKNVSIDVDYYEKMYKLILQDEKNALGFNMYPTDFERMKFMFLLFKKSLKEKVIYDYDSMFYYKVTITANAENIERIKENTKKYWEEQRELSMSYECESYEISISNYEDEINKLREKNTELQEQVDELEKFKERVQDTLGE